MTITTPHLLFRYAERETNNSDLTDRQLLEEFSAAHFPDKHFDYNEVQRVGTGYDCTIGGCRVEIKNDKMSVETGNLFVETTQTFDGWKTTHLSGLNLCLTQDVVLFVMVAYIGEQSFFIWSAPQQWRNLCRNRVTGETKKGRHGNPERSYAKGFLIPLEDLI